jgi:hypothetical protein
MRTICFDSQILTTFQECAEKYYLTFIENLKPAHPVDPLVKGDVMHTGLEAYYRYLKAGLAGEQSRPLLHTQAVEIAAVEMDAKAALNGISLELAEEVKKATLEYLDFYRNDDLVPLEIEEPFIMVLYESPKDDLRICYAGKIDLVATASRYQWKPVPFDNKSTTRNQTPSGRSNQFFGYTVALDTSQLVVNRIGFQKTLSAAERFKRIPLSYPPEYRQRWVRNTIKWGYKLVFALENQQYEENLSSCDKYSGCAMKPICESINPEAREWVIQSKYITGEKWDPTKLLALKEAEPNNVYLPPSIEESGRLGLPSPNDANKGE